MKIKDNSINLIADWILNSGIQSPVGGFFSWHNLGSREYSYLYSEITGYGITTLLFLYSVSGDNVYIKRAVEAADWIIKTSMHPCGGVRTRLYKDDSKANREYSFSGARIFSFDTGMVLYGMVSIYKATGKKKYLDASTKLAEFLLEKVQREDGSLSPIYDANIDEQIEPSDKWSSQSGAFHAKVSMGLADLFDATKKDIYKKAAIKICNNAISAQERSGRFITDRILKTTHVHPHSYAAEGLWYTGNSLKIADFTKSAKKAVEWSFKCVLTSGINELYNPISDSFSNFQRSDILAQTLRLGAICSMADSKIGLLRDLLLSYQFINNRSKQRGGFFYCRENRDINSWCSMFSLQALMLDQDRGLISNGFLLV